MTWMALVAGVAGLVAAMLGVAAAALLWMKHRLLIIDVDGISMAPTLRAGERVLVRRVPFRRVQPGHIVLVEGISEGPAGGPERPAGRPRLILKRAAAVAGDPVPAPVARALAAGSGAAVPAGHLVVLGDNPDYSFDSRNFGYLPGDRVVGVVRRRL